MAVQFKSEEELQNYIDNLGTEYRFSCFHEQNAEGCHLLADYLVAVKKDFEGAAKVLQPNCDERNYAKSCMTFGNYALLGRGCEASNQTAFKYYKKACDMGSNDGCLHCGVFLTSKNEKNNNSEPLPLDFVTGLQFLEKSCTGGNASGCFFASGLYIAGAEGVPKDRTKAAELSQMACDGGNIYACMNVSKMYKVGDGVVKDETKSDFYKEKAKEIRRDNARKPTIGLQQYT